MKTQYHLSDHLGKDARAWLPCVAKHGLCPFKQHYDVDGVMAKSRKLAKEGKPVPPLHTTAGTVRTFVQLEGGGFMFGKRMYDDEGQPVLSPATLRSKKSREKKRRQREQEASGYADKPVPTLVAVPSPVEPESGEAGDEAAVAEEPGASVAETPEATDNGWNSRPWKERKKELEAFAYDELRRAGLYHIPVKWSRAQSTWGYARTVINRWTGDIMERELFMNEKCVDLDEDSVKGIVLHEVAHFLTPNDHHHGAQFVAACADVDGGRGIVKDKHSYERTDDEWERTRARVTREVEEEATAVLKWVGTCPQGHERFRKGKPRATWLCAYEECKALPEDQRTITYTKRDL